MDDAALLHAYARERDQAAFTALVRRHVDLVHAAALRRTGGDARKAQDVTQQVFIDLAKKAASLTRHPALPAWLHRSTRFAAANLHREENRRRIREESAAREAETLSASTEPTADWTQLAPVLDAALDTLGETDRQAVVLRFFGNQSFAYIAARLHTTEAAAQMRAARALEKLRGALAKRGITSTTTAIGLALAGQAVTAAPAWVAPGVLTALAANAATTATVSTFLTMSLFKHVVTGIVCASLAGIAIYQFTGTASIPVAVPAALPPSSAPAAVVTPASADPAAPDPRLAALVAENAELRARLASAETDRASTRDKLAELRRPMTADILSSTLQATLRPGETVVTGGFRINGEQRMYALAKPTRDANGKIVISGQMLALSDEGSRGIGIDNLSTDTANTLQHGEIWSAGELESVLAKLPTLPGTDAMSLPELHIPLGKSASYEIGPLLYKMTPTLAADGSSIVMDVRLENPLVSPAEKTTSLKK